MVFPGYTPKSQSGGNKLKPCPLCSSPADVGKNLRRVPTYMCICRECGYYGPVRLTKRGAIRAWNRRKEAPNA